MTIFLIIKELNGFFNATSFLKLDFLFFFLDNILMKKICLCLLILLFALLSIPAESYVSFADIQYITINAAYCYLYKSPSYEQHYDFKINSGEKVQLLETSDDFYKVIYIYEEQDFTGYIPTELASVFVQDQTELPVYNGRIIKKTEVYQLDGTLYEGIELAPDTQIYIYEGFDADNEFTKIKFCYENQIYIGQVKTINLSPNGVNKAVIIAYSIIAAIVGVILILLGFKTGKKWHKLLKNKKK